MSLDILRRFQSIFGRQSDLLSQIEIERIVRVDGCGVGIETAAKYLNGNIEAHDFFPFRVSTILFGFIRIIGFGTDELTDELIG